MSEMCTLNGEKCRVLCTATPAMDLLSAQTVMDRHSVSQIPVVSEQVEDHNGHVVGLLDRECISVACRYFDRLLFQLYKWLEQYNFFFSWTFCM